MRKAIQLYATPETVDRLDFLKRYLGADSTNHLLEVLVDDYYQRAVREAYEDTGTSILT